ncbi:hypothetical protein GGI13_004043 [Coemansia sp. RSA 455]|nr:hypothetical protein GGI13_004043 [Coemansia sp. RSA 455]
MNAEGIRYTLEFKAVNNNGERVANLNDAENIESSTDLVSFRHATIQLATQLEGCDSIIKDNAYDRFKVFDPTNLVFSFDGNIYTYYDKDPINEHWKEARTIAIWFLVSPKVFENTGSEGARQVANEITTMRESLATSSRSKCSIM